MAVLNILVGLPGSGKSTYAKRVIQGMINPKNTVYLSSDQTRIDMFGYENQNENDKVFNRMQQDTIFALQNDFDVIYDATNLSKKRRMNLINNVVKRIDDLTINAYLFCAPISVILERNITRTERHLPWEKLTQMITYIEPPMYYEGFDNIYLIDGGMYSDLYDYNILINECVDYDQNTPYHNDTLEKHIINTVERVSELAENLGLDLFTERTLVEAAKYHDFGKLYCRTFNENKNTCSYYNHHNVSTYMYLCHIRKQCLVDSFNRVRLSDKKYQVAALILNHMQWYMRDNMQPIKDLFNDDNLFNMLELLHYADKYRK